MTSKRTVKWTMSNGKEITVEIEVGRKHITSEILYADGDNVTVDRDEIQESHSIVAYVDGAEFDRCGFDRPSRIPANDRGIVAVIGEKVGLLADTYKLVNDAIDEAIAEAESDPEIAACRERIAKREAAFDAAQAEYDEFVARRERAMNQ